MNAEINANNELKLVLEKYAKLDMFQGYEITSPLSAGPDGDTPFHMAAFDGDLDAVKLMLPFVKNINLGGDNGNSPLHYAVMHKQPAMAKYLMSNGASPEQKNDYGDTPAEYMVGDEIFSDLLAVLKGKG